MKIGLRSVLGATAAILALHVGCSPSVTSSCNATCPIGCDVSADCLSCVPESSSDGAGTACTVDTDCCTGTCVSGVCTATGLSLGASGGGGSTGGNGSTSGGTTQGGSSSSGASSSNSATCTPASPPTAASDAACGNTSEWVCSPTGQCVPNCNASPSYCGSVVCEVNGHCYAPTASGSGSTSSSSGSGSTSSSSKSSSSTSSSGGRSSSTSSSSSGSSSSGGKGCGGSSQEYTSCTANSDCACPDNCVAIPSGGSYCLAPCTSFQSCQMDEICDGQLPVKSCYPNGCTAPWGACAGGNDTGGSQTGTCNVFADAQGAFGLCVAGGGGATGGSCAFNASWSAIAQECVPGDICGEAASASSGSCYQACDPTGSLGGPACLGGTTCNGYACDCTTDAACSCFSGAPPSCDPTADPNCDPYFGVCQ